VAATRRARGIDAWEVSSREVVAGHSARIDADNPALNALSDVRPDVAPAAAKAGGDMVAARVELGPVHRPPVAAKVNSDQTGCATTNGAVAFANQGRGEGQRSRSDHVQVRRGLPGPQQLPRVLLPLVHHHDLHGWALNP
jgi:Asp-tRNA(Asn)/Glu-tRNA(Gln) amidotransferase A subunit family amidase